MLIALIVVSLIAIFLFVRAFKLSLSNAELSDIIIEQHKELDKSHDAVKEGFLKFVSDSREWAFEYIEEVQKSLNEFSNTINPIIDHFDKYSDTLSIKRPDYESLKTISAAYKELLKVLPEDEDAKIKKS